MIRAAIIKTSKVASVLLITAVLLEMGLRAAKSTRLDGVLYLAGPSINARLHAEYGWMSRPGLTFHKCDECYGEGTVSYNAAGFRAPPLSEAEGAAPVICVIGDSTMQGYQIPDGGHLPHLLSAEMEARGFDPYVLPLAVGGYGSVQEWMLFRDYCLPLEPDLVVWHWSENDPYDNSYLSDRFGGPNHGRPRPYLMGGEITLRRPYPLRIWDPLDVTMVMRLANGLVLRMQQAELPTLERYWESGWEVADEIAARVAAATAAPIALVPAEEERAAGMFERQGFDVVTYRIPDEFTCLPRDHHPTSDGHRRMLEALMPTLLPILEANPEA